MSSRSRHRFLEKSIRNVSFHNRLTEEESMWRRRENELRDDEEEKPRVNVERRRSIDERKSMKKVKQTEGEFGPPLPSSLGVNADRWDHAHFMQRYPDEYQRQLEKCRRSSSETSQEEKSKKKKKQKKKKRHRNSESDDEHRKKSKRKRHRSKS